MTSSDTSADGADRYEVVITPRDGCEKEYADLLRRRLLADGFYEDVVEVRKVETGTDQ